MHRNAQPRMFNTNFPITRIKQSETITRMLGVAKPSRHNPRTPW